MTESVQTRKLRLDAEKIADASPCQAYQVFKAADEIDRLRAENARLNLTLSHYTKMSQQAAKSAKLNEVF